MISSTEKVAVIDIGSNSVRLFIFEILENEAARIYARQIYASKHFCGLGKDLGTTGRLNKDAVAVTFSHLKSFIRDIEEYAARKTVAIGTAALREALDAGAFLQRVKTETGFEIQVIDGKQEALFAAKGLLFHLPQAKGVVADFGGGSLELARVENGDIAASASFKLGAHYLKTHHDIDDLIRSELADHGDFLRPLCLYVTGGSWRSLVKAWAVDHGHKEVSPELLEFAGPELADFCNNLEKMAPDDLVDRYGMENQRAVLMDVSAVMLRHLIQMLEPERIAVSLSGIRDGIVYDLVKEASANKKQ